MPTSGHANGLTGRPPPRKSLSSACRPTGRNGAARPGYRGVAGPRLDVLVNNAGIAIFKPILNITYEGWSRVLAVNLTGPFLCTQAAAPLIRDSGGGAVVIWSNDFDQIAYGWCINRPKKGELIF